MRPSAIASRAVLLTLFWAGSLSAQQPVYNLRNSWTSPCTLDVVLVTFKDTTARHEGAVERPRRHHLGSRSTQEESDPCAPACTNT